MYKNTVSEFLSAKGSFSSIDVITCTCSKKKKNFLVNPFMPNGISHHYQLDESFSNIRFVG